MKSDTKLHQAISSFVECLSGTGTQAEACTALLAWAEFELSTDQDYLALDADELRLRHLANNPRAALAEPEAYRAERTIDEGTSREDIISGKAIRPAYDLQRSHCWFAAPRMDRLGECSVRLVLRSFAGRLAEKNVVFVLPEGARLDEHALHWAKLLNDALGGPRARLLRVTWTAKGWGRGLGFGEGAQLATRQGAVVQRLADAATGEAFTLCLRLVDGQSDNESAYRLDLAYDKTHSAQPTPTEPFASPLGAYDLEPEGAVERLQVDCVLGLLVAKFSNEHHLLEYDAWTRAWRKPKTAQLFGESGYDRAYYLGQGCWENMEDLPAKTAHAVLQNGWLGDVRLEGDALRVALPNGDWLAIDRTTGKLRDVKHVPAARDKELVHRKRPASTKELVRRFNTTRAVTRQRAYWVGDTMVTLGRSAEELAHAEVLREADVLELVEHPSYTPSYELGGKCVVQVTDEDSLGGAYELTKYLDGGKLPLVLNFANPHEPGGGVTRGARAQEEDLCRRSTLYASLTSPAARGYYQENLATYSNLFRHNAILSPHVVVFRDADGDYLPEPFEVAVLTMAAPYVPGLLGVSRDELRVTIKTRVLGVLHVAACHGYTNLVLGAWGCGAFGNDPHLVSGVFKEALREYRSGHGGDPTGGLTYNSVFRHVRFAVPPGPNHQAFAGTLGQPIQTEERG